LLGAIVLQWPDPRRRSHERVELEAVDRLGAALVDRDDLAVERTRAGCLKLNAAV
jgi:hypothetical protein